MVFLVLAFQSSGALASAYGIAVTGTMVITTALLALHLHLGRGIRLGLVLLVLSPVALLELAFLTANAMKLADGGYVPVLLALALGVVMWGWWRGSQVILARSHAKALDLTSFVTSMAHSSAHVVPGTAFFLTPDNTTVPSALLHNLKHNRVLHEQNILLTVETMRVPVATPEERVQIDRLDDRFIRLTLRFGFMETPNVSRALGVARKAGLKFDVMATSFFLGRRRAIVTGPFGIDRALDRIYAVLSRLAADPSEFYHLPRDRVIELGERVLI